MPLLLLPLGYCVIIVTPLGYYVMPIVSYAGLFQLCRATGAARAVDRRRLGSVDRLPGWSVPRQSCGIDAWLVNGGDALQDGREAAEVCRVIYLTGHGGLLAIGLAGASEG